jgi:Ca2+-binding RTX toxin-like protein
MIETLEPRQLFAVPFTATLDATGLLTVQIAPGLAHGVIVARTAGLPQIQIDDTAGTSSTPTGLLRKTFSASLVKNIRILGNDQANSIRMRSLNAPQIKLVTVETYGGDDYIDAHLSGSNNAIMHIYAGSGQDFVGSGNGNDAIFGGEHTDDIYGWGGNDLIWGEGGADYLLGCAGNDTLIGGAGADWIHGESFDGATPSAGYVDVSYYDPAESDFDERGIELRYPILSLPPPGLPLP